MTVELISLGLPILLATVALFFVGFLCWAVLPNHKPDWVKLPNQQDFLNKIAELNIPPGNYLYPHAPDGESMRTAEYQQAVERRTFGTLQVWGGPPQMGPNLACQFGYLLVVNFCLAYLATLALESGDNFMTVFRFVTTAAFLTYTTAVVPGTIWFKNRLTGHILDGVLHAVVIGAIFAWLWPSGPPA